MALRDALQKGGSALLEPIMKVEVEAPYTYAGGVIRDLQPGGASFSITMPMSGALVPLANMFGYQQALDAMSGGRARFRMELITTSRYPRMMMIRHSGPRLGCGLNAT
jgi:elongation factor G